MASLEVEPCPDWTSAGENETSHSRGALLAPAPHDAEAPALSQLRQVTLLEYIHTPQHPILDVLLKNPPRTSMPPS